MRGCEGGWVGGCESEEVKRAQHRIASTDEHAINMDNKKVMSHVVRGDGTKLGNAGDMVNTKPKSRLPGQPDLLGRGAASVAVPPHVVERPELGADDSAFEPPPEMDARQCDMHGGGASIGTVSERAVAEGVRVVTAPCSCALAKTTLQAR